MIGQDNQDLVASSYKPGVYVKSGVIETAVDFAKDVEVPFDKTEIIGITLTFDIGRDWKQEVHVTGYPARDAGKNVIGFNRSTEGLRYLIAKVAQPPADSPVWVNDEGFISPDVLNLLPGKEVWYVSYVYGIKEDGKLRYKPWRRVFLTEEEAQSAWDVSVSEGFPKDYKPDLLSQRVDTPVESAPTPAASLNQL